MPMRITGPIATVILATLLAACGGSSPNQGPTLFEARSPEETGVTFANRLAESAPLNMVNYLYYYNGGGVAVGDVNGDGLADLYFTANEGPNALYLNRGDFTFEEVTEAAGVAGTADWASGVTMADVNGDGRLDIYVLAVSGYLGLEGRNELFMNQGVDAEGVPQFDEQAAAYNLDDAGYGTHAAFFDYDGDGDLDVYLVNHSTHDERTYERADVRAQRHPKAGDKLYRNESNRFVDVSAEAGIYGSRVGYGLGVAVSDFDRDGHPDLYVANDFHENDYLYFNNGDGTFTETIASSTRHNSLSSMGVDAADVNNDGRSDVVVLDMMPSDEATRKTTAGNDTEDVYRLKRQYGYHHQLARNTLQLNQGQRRLSEVGLMAGIHATDWSWAPLLADLNNDGQKDLFVSNGIYRRPNDLDYIDYVSNEFMPSMGRDVMGRDTMLLERMPRAEVPNVAFRNDGNLQFSDRSAAWGIDRPGTTNGAAYADLDNDGDLDLVTNNINAPASILENRADSLTSRHALTIRLDGDAPNTYGIGATLEVVQGGRRQWLEQQPSRGYQSSVDPRLHVGLDTLAIIDTLRVTWRDGRQQVLTNVEADQAITLRQAEASAQRPEPTELPPAPRFTDVTEEMAIDYRHEENRFNDFVREPLMPHKVSTEGPALAVGDVNGDGLDDLFAGGARGQPAQLLIQQSDGGFQPTSEALWAEDQRHEDVDAVFFDADGNGALDLYVVSGGNEFWGTAEPLRDRLYLNDTGSEAGTGGVRFRRAEDALPDSMLANGGTVAPADFDADGDVDLFVGSRVVARQYGAIPTSYLLENDGAGRFRDVTAEQAPALAEAGMVADATWLDATGDGALDLVVVGTWMPIRVFERQDGRFEEQTVAAGFGATNGWWNAVHATDLDGDGDTDLVAGNLGLNSLLKATAEQPIRLYRVDVDGNGRRESILTYVNDGVSYPFYNLDLLAQQIDGLRTRFPTYESFGDSRIDDLVPADRLEEATVRMAHTFAHVWAENQGDGTFALHDLPARAQIAPLYALLADDIDGDGQQDLVAGGNFHGVRAEQGRYDASYGHWLRGTEDGLTAVPPIESNLYLEGEVRALHLLRGAEGARFLVAARNDDRLQVIRVPATEAAPLAGR